MNIDTALRHLFILPNVARVLITTDRDISDDGIESGPVRVHIFTRNDHQISASGETVEDAKREAERLLMQTWEPQPA